MVAKRKKGRTGDKREWVEENGRFEFDFEFAQNCLAPGCVLTC
jgi:hypothetical protein